MKKFILAAIATSLIASPVMAAPQPQQHRGAQKTVVVKKQVKRVPAKKIVVKRNVYKPASAQYRNWRKGERFDARYARNYRQIDYRQYRTLKAPPRGYHYVRSGNDAVLVAIAGGVIGAVIAGAFN